MSLLRRLTNRLRRPRPVHLDPQLAALEAALRRPDARRRNTPGRGTR